MKLLNVNSYYYSSTVHYNLKLQLDRCGLKSSTFVPVIKNYIPRKECLDTDDKDVVKKECYGKIDRYIFFSKNYKMLKEVQRCFNLKEYDLIHAHSLFTNGFIAMKLKKKYGIPYIVTVRDTDLNVFFKKAYHLRKLGVSILSEANKVFFLSKPYLETTLKRYVKGEAAKEITNKALVIPNGIDEFWLKNINKSKRVPNLDRIRILFVGGINKRKNVVGVINALEILREKGYDVAFTIVGENQDKEIYSKIMNVDFVNYIPPRNKQELLTIYRSHDIYVMPSFTETFGLVYAEALSQGTPVIYSKNQGFDGQFMEGEVGYSVDPNNHNEIAERIVDVLENYSEISENCVVNSVKFDWNRISHEICSVYMTIE